MQYYVLYNGSHCSEQICHIIMLTSGKPYYYLFIIVLEKISPPDSTTGTLVPTESPPIEGLCYQYITIYVCI